MMTLIIDANIGKSGLECLAETPTPHTRRNSVAIVSKPTRDSCRHPVPPSDRNVLHSHGGCWRVAAALAGLWHQFSQG